MHYVWLQSSIWSNRFKTVMLVVLFPTLLLVVLGGVFFGLLIYEGANIDQAIQESLSGMVSILGIFGPLMIIRGLISFFFHRQIIFSFTGAKPVTRKEEPEIYNIIENLCISRGLQTPRIGIIEDESCNAFAVWRDVKHAWIVFSRGILNKLNKSEIEAVAGHELTHIINKDSLLMIVVIVFIGMIATLGEILIRTWSRDKKWGSIALVGLALLLLGYLFFPLIQLAISRKREFLADAGAVELTKDKHAMIGALQKIGADSVIESIDKQTIAAMCIETPFQHKKSGFFRNLLSTHPSIEDRIAALQHY